MKPHDLIFIVLGQHLIHLYNGLRRKVSQSMSVFQTLSLMLLFGTFLIALLSYIDKHHK